MNKRLIVGALLVTSLMLAGCDPKDLPPACRVDGVADPTAVPPTDVTITPESLRTLLFNGNTSVLLGLNRLHQAKEQVNVARGNLLPSIQLGGLLYSGGNPVFILSTVEFLVPFLVPARWFDYYKVKDLLQAEFRALKLLRLNQYASAYSLTLAMNSDSQLLRTLEEEVTDLAEIERTVEALYHSGAAPLADLNQARTQTELARIHANKVAELVHSEYSSLRRALGLAASTSMSLLDSAPPVSEWEDATLEAALPQTLALSPEVEQLSFLKKAAEKDRWSKVFGFLSGASVRSESIGSDHSAALSDSGAGLGFGLGFSYYPAIQLSQQQVLALGLREKELENELTDVLDISLTAVKNSKIRLTMTERAISNASENYQAKLTQYQVGAVSLSDLLRARSALRESKIEEIQAKARVNMSRVTLHRTLLSDQFQNIEGCDILNAGDAASEAPLNERSDSSAPTG